MEFIKSRKKIAKSAIASSLSIVATTAMAAQENSVALPLIHVQADAERLHRALKLINRLTLNLSHLY